MINVIKTRDECLLNIKHLLPSNPVTCEIGFFRGEFSKLINDIFEPENSVSTHSSMPSLVDVDSVSTHSSMPSLVDDDSEDENDDDNSTQSSLTWLEDDWSDSSIPPPLIDEYGNIIE